MRPRNAILGAFLFSLAVTAALAQDVSPVKSRMASADNRMASMYGGLDGPGPADVISLPATLSAFPLTTPVTQPHMAPELALTTYLNAAQWQLRELGSYSDDTVIEADLPSTSQHGRFELRRTYQAPRSLVFAALHFAGDSFVKTNVITKLLQSEVDHVQKGEGAQTAITGENYKFSWKGSDTLDGRTYYRYQVKPRQKRPGLFKGFILVDAATGRLRRAEGTMVKSPSLFVKKIEFLQDYGEYGPFSLPVHIHSVAKTRLVGRAVVEIHHSDYAAKTLDEVQSQAGSSSSAGASSN